MVRLALETPYVGGVCIQPQFASGRSGPIDPLDRLTHGGVLTGLGPQTEGLVTWRDMTALPCSHPRCCSVGYLLRDDEGRWRSLVGVLGHDRLRDHLDLVSNRIADRELPRGLRRAVEAALLGLLSEQSSLTHPDIGEVFRTLWDSCDLGLSTLWQLAAGSVTGRPPRGLRDLLARRVVRLTVKPFMDISQMLEERLLQCCVHVGTRADDGAHQCAPFCAAQAWGPLNEQRPAAVVVRRERSRPPPERRVTRELPYGGARPSVLPAHGGRPPSGVGERVPAGSPALLRAAHRGRDRVGHHPGVRRDGPRRAGGGRLPAGVALRSPTQPLQARGRPSGDGLPGGRRARRGGRDRRRRSGPPPGLTDTPGRRSPPAGLRHNPRDGGRVTQQAVVVGD